MSPARQRVELEGVEGDEGLGIDLLAAAIGLVLEAAVKPDSLERLALGQSVDALQLWAKEVREIPGCSLAEPGQPTPSGSLPGV